MEPGHTEDENLDGYTRRYREIGGRDSDFQVFADAGQRSRRRPFNTGYVELSVGSRGHGVGGGETDAAAVVGESPLVLLRGAAGSGKTTLLQRLELLTLHTDAPPNAGLIPFRLRLANLHDGQLPIDDLTGFLPEWAEPPPAGWVHRVFDRGRALVLLDGLDKVALEHRDALHRSFRILAVRYPRTRVWISTRHAVDDQLWLGSGFAPFDLLPMSRPTFVDFVERWHLAARADQGRHTAVEPDELRDKQRRLIELIDRRPRLQYMSRVPLLCELLCFLHDQRGGEELPHHRKDVYDQILDILINKFGGPRPDIDLSWKRKRLLLETLGGDFVAEKENPVPRKVLIARIQYSLGAMTDDVDPAEVLNWLLVHSGLFKEDPATGAVRFVHQTFRDHLGGIFLANRQAEAQLLDLAEATESHDVVAMAASHMSSQDAGRRFLDELYKRATTATEPARRDTLLLAAMACLDQIDVLYEPDLEGRPPIRQRIRDSASPLLRPVDLDRAAWLIEAGPGVIDLLPTPAEVHGEPSARFLVRVLAIQTARGVPGALDALRAHVGAEEHLLLELINCWPDADHAEEYAAAVLAWFDFSGVEITLSVRHSGVLPYIGHASSVTSLRIRRDYPDLRPLADLPALRELHLFGLSYTNLAGLEECRSLRHLTLTQCQASAGMVDLAPVARLGLDRLSIGKGMVIGPVAHLTLGTVHELPTSLRVETLEWTATQADRDLVAASPLPRTLEKLIVNGVPRPAELGVLVDLEEFRHLVVKDVAPSTRIPDRPAGARFRISVEPGG